MNDSAPTVSRRRFTLTAALLATSATLPPFAGSSTTVTPRDVVAMIRATCAAEGIRWSDDSIDTFKLGNPDQPISGVATAFMGTMDVMKRAVDLGANFIISHEPIFYNHADDTRALEAREDPVYTAKVRFAERHGLTVWRFHDHFHQIDPEPVTTAAYRKLGWTPYVEESTAGRWPRINHPPTTLAALAQELRDRLPTHSLRAIGDPALEIRRIGQTGHSIGGVIDCLADCDVGIAAEVREWDSVEYARDAVALGMAKAMIAIAHERGEQDGVAMVADWLKRAVRGRVPVYYLASGEPFRTL